MLMGEFNAVRDMATDKTSKKKGGRLSRIFFDLMTQEQLEDIWRLKNKDVKDYMFYSASQKMWSRTDMIWINKSMCPWIKRAEILPKVLSDHNPVPGVFRLKGDAFRWRLNEEL